MIRVHAPSRTVAAGPRLLVGRTLPSADPARPSDIGAPPPAPARDAMAPPDGAAVSDDAMGLTQRELLMEMREDIHVHADGPREGPRMAALQFS